MKALFFFITDEDEDEPIFNGFSDDEPLVLA